MIKSVQEGKDAEKIAPQTIQDSQEHSSIKRKKRKCKNSPNTSTASLICAQAMSVSLCNDRSVVNTRISVICLLISY